MITLTNRYNEFTLDVVAGTGVIEDIKLTGAIDFISIVPKAGQNVGLTVSITDPGANNLVLASSTGLTAVVRRPRFQATDGAGVAITGVYGPHAVSDRTIRVTITVANIGTEAVRIKIQTIGID